MPRMTPADPARGGEGGGPSSGAGDGAGAAQRATAPRQDLRGRERQSLLPSHRTRKRSAVMAGRHPEAGQVLPWTGQGLSPVWAETRCGVPGGKPEARPDRWPQTHSKHHRIPGSILNGFEHGFIPGRLLKGICSFTKRKVSKAPQSRPFSALLAFPESRWVGWLPLTASRCQDVKAIRQSRADGSHPDGDYDDRPRFGQERFPGSRR